MTMPAQPAMPPQGPPKKKGMSTGCMVAIGVVLFFFLSVGGVLAYIGYKVATNPDVQHVMGAIGEATQLAAEAQSAPGTNELRALGCEQAMALDAVKMQKLVESFVDAGTGTPPPPPEVEKWVMCQVGAFGTAPSCDDAAKAYVRGASPRSKFMLMVQQNRQNQCGGIYSPAGTMVAPVGSGHARF